MPLPQPGRAALTGTALALALLATGCSGGDDETSTPSSSSSPGTAPTTPADASSSAEPTTGKDYLPVPSGVTLSEPGSELGLKESAVAAWEPRQDLVGVLDLAVTRIDRTTVQASLAGFDLQGDEQRSTPYFVRTRVTNVGDTDLGARGLPLYASDGRGALIAPTGVAPDFEACPGSTLPTVFAPGEKAMSCLIFLAPEGSELESIMFRPPEGVVPLQWSGKVTTLGKGKGKGSAGDTKGSKSGGKKSNGKKNG